MHLRVGRWAAVAVATAAGLIALASPAPANAQAWPDVSAPPALADQGGGRDAAVVIAIDDYAFVADVPGARRNGSTGMRSSPTRGRCRSSGSSS